MLATDVMRSSFATIKPTANVLDAVQLLLETDQRGLPVINDDGDLVGMISEGDFYFIAIPQQNRLGSSEAGKQRRCSSKSSTAEHRPDSRRGSA